MHTINKLTVIVEGGIGRMNKPDENIFLSDLLNKYPEALEVLLTNGFEDFAENDTFVEIAPFIKLKTLLRSRNINEKSFLKALSDKIDAAAIDRFLNSPQQEPTDKTNILALLPCPLKLPLQQAFIEHMNRYPVQSANLNYLIEGNANNQLTYYDYVEQFEDIEDIPDIVISPGINSFYYKNFADKFINKGLFIDVAQYSPNKALLDAGIKDPLGNYTILCMNLLVMAVDKLKLGNQPLPKKWGDLLEPEFAGKVAIRGKNMTFCETTLLTIYKQYGMEGIRKLGRSVKYGWHPSQMAKTAGSGSENSPVVSVMPYFFTRTIKYKENVQIVWPEDGAIISPVTMLVKTDKAEKLKNITDFFTGKEAGRISADANFPTLHPDVDNKIPQGTAFNWVGWDFIRENDIGKLIKELNSEFAKAFVMRR